VSDVEHPDGVGDCDLRYLIRKAILNLRMLHAEIWADPLVARPLEQARRVADRMALMSRSRGEGCRGNRAGTEGWREAA